MAETQEESELSELHKVAGEKLFEKVKVAQVGKWEKPWISLPNGLPRNGTSGKAYQGENCAVLIAAGFSDARWFTINQLKEMAADGMELDWRGQKSYPVVRAVPVFAKDKETGDLLLDDNGQPKKFFEKKWVANVINAECVKGMAPAEERVFNIEPSFACEQLAIALKERTNLKVVEGGDVACYIPSRHEVRVPKLEHFKTDMGAHLTSLHEFAHSTGPELKRPMEGRWASESYAKEEFVAETACVFMASELGLSMDEYHHDQKALYLQSWEKSIGEDKSYIFKTISDASKATTYQMEHLREYLHELSMKKEATEDQLLLIKDVGEPARVVKAREAEYEAANPKPAYVKRPAPSERREKKVMTNTKKRSMAR